MGSCIDYFYNPKVYRLSEDEIKSLKDGQVVWFIHRNGQECKIHWGVIKCICCDGVIVELYSFNDKAKVCIDGELIDYKLAPCRTKENPLPKGWKYDMNLTIHKEYLEDILELYSSLYNPKSNTFKTEESIRKLIEDETLLPNSEIDFSYYTEVVEKKTYYCVKSYDSTQARFNEFKDLSRKLNYTNVFTTYKTAEDELNKIHAEKERVAGLTDDEWGKEEVAKTLTHFINLYVRIIDIETCKEFHKFVMKEIEKFLQKKNKDWYDIKVRIFGRILQYKFGDKGKYKELVEDIAEEFYDGFKNKYEIYLADKECFHRKELI